jgi:hypothetical protein
MPRSRFWSALHRSSVGAHGAIRDNQMRSCCFSRGLPMLWNRKQWMGCVVLTTYLPLVVPFPLVLAAIAPIDSAHCSELKCECCSEDVAEHCSRVPADVPPLSGSCPCPLCPDDGQQNNTCICFACAKFIDSAARILDTEEQSHYFSDSLRPSVCAATSVDCWRPPRV